MVLQPPLAQLGALASQQHGAFTRLQALDAGLTAGQIDWRVHTGAWRALDHGVYATAGTPSSWHQQLISACLAGPAVASHRSAAALWNLPGFDNDVVEVTAVRHLRRHVPAVVWHESHRLDEREVTMVDGIQTTRPSRTIVDLGAVVDGPHLLIAFDDALRRGLVSAGSVRAVLESMDSRRRGSGAVRRMLEQRTDDEAVPESVLETMFDQLVRDHGLPSPTRQYRVRADTGSVVARIDFAYPAQRLAIEVDSARFHAGSEHWRADLARMNVLVALGWRILRFTHADLRDRAGEVAHAISDALSSKMRI